MLTITSSSISIVNKRKVDRIPTFLEAQLLAPNREPIECVVWDITNRGAKIGIDNEVLLPLFFDLRVSGYNDVFRCEGRWRTTEFVGVRFHPY